MAAARRSFRAVEPEGDAQSGPACSGGGIREASAQSIMNDAGNVTEKFTFEKPCVTCATLKVTGRARTLRLFSHKSTSAWTMTSSPSLEQIIEGEPTAPVKTKIVCTLGPKVRRRPNTQLFSSRRLLPFTL